MYILDTDYLGILQSQNDPVFLRLWEKIIKQDFHNFFVTIISFHEQIAGWFSYLNKAKSIKEVAKGYLMFQGILKDFTSFQVLGYDDSSAKIFADMRKSKVRIGTMDLRIASIALAQGFTILTRNLVDFEKVPNLKVEDWTVDHST